MTADEQRLRDAARESAAALPPLTEAQARRVAQILYPQGSDGPKRPVVYPKSITPNRTYPGAFLVTIDCPHCGREHTHGLPAGETRAGHRASHCGSSRGYVIEAMEDPK